MSLQIVHKFLGEGLNKSHFRTDPKNNLHVILYML